MGQKRKKNIALIAIGVGVLMIVALVIIILQHGEAESKEPDFSAEESMTAGAEVTTPVSDFTMETESGISSENITESDDATQSPDTTEAVTETEVTTTNAETSEAETTKIVVSTTEPETTTNLETTTQEATTRKEELTSRQQETTNREKKTTEEVTTTEAVTTTEEETTLGEGHYVKISKDLKTLTVGPGYTEITAGLIHKEHEAFCKKYLWGYEGITNDPLAGTIEVIYFEGAVIYGNAPIVYTSYNENLRNLTVYATNCSYHDVTVFDGDNRVFDQIENSYCSLWNFICRMAPPNMGGGEGCNGKHVKIVLKDLTLELFEDATLEVNGHVMDPLWKLKDFISYLESNADE